MGNLRLFSLALGLVIIVAASGAYFYLQQIRNTPSGATSYCQNLIASASSATNTERVAVNVLMNYGNGTVRWYNYTNAPSNWNLYDLTLYVADCNVDATFYGPPLNEHFVKAINGLRAAGQYSWSIWTYCQGPSVWVYSSVGADQVVLKSGEILAWAYQSSSSQPPIPGARTASSCS